jgi:hypothetical protein
MSYSRSSCVMVRSLMNASKDHGCAYLDAVTCTAVIETCKLLASRWHTYVGLKARFLAGTTPGPLCARRVHGVLTVLASREFGHIRGRKGTERDKESKRQAGRRHGLANLRGLSPGAKFERSALPRLRTANLRGCASSHLRPRNKIYLGDT